MNIASHFQALRPRQWTKNGIIFAAPLFTLDFTPTIILKTALAFVLFSAMSSSFYLINDIIDVRADRIHPVKRKRPIASGQVKVRTAKIMAGGLFLSAMGLGWLTDSSLGATLGLYALLQIAYNIRLKRTVILDVMAIAIGFVLRSVAGAAVNQDLVVSSWFLLCVAFLALFLGIEKRKAELRLSQIGSGKTRSVLRRYSFLLLGRMENVVTAGAVITYALWSSGPQVNGASTPWMMLTLPLVLYGLFRYQLLSDPQIMGREQLDRYQGSERSERPEEVLLSDKPILLTVIAWVGTVVIILGLYKHGIIQ
jgi:decaprenyl-phosphate phosphoribosyltransferase